jgi:hypothetical protein
VIGWPLGKAGRKLFAGTALFAGGTLCGYSRQTWVVLKDRAADRNGSF